MKAMDFEPLTADQPADDHRWTDYLAEEGVYDAYDEIEPKAYRCDEPDCGRWLPCRRHG